MKVAVLLSGGVDSSVALALLAQAGRYELTAFYLKIWLEEELAFLGNCPWEEDLRYVCGVCEQLAVPLQVVSLQSEYLEKVVEQSLSELRAGRTPCPDVFCNQRIKFGVFLDRLGPSYDKVASGHYAVCDWQQGVFLLKRSADPVKDQTYFLSHLDQRQLGRALFPIGHLHKVGVRRLAAGFGLPTQDRRDSQGICFLGRIPYREFVRFHLGTRPGPIVIRETGAQLGEHEGHWFHTIGQRHGLRLAAGPWYVVGKDIHSNVVYVSHWDQREQRERRRFRASRLNWIAGRPTTTEVQVRLRHGPAMEWCRIAFTGDDELEVELARPDTGIAPGQCAVFYHGCLCLGGGTIQ